VKGEDVKGEDVKGERCKIKVMVMAGKEGRRAKL